MIEVKHISKSFKQGDTTTEVLKDINFTVSDGEVICLYGPSGSGKSTLLTIIGALLQPTSGEVIINGKSLSNLSKSDITLSLIHI